MPVAQHGQGVFLFEDHNRRYLDGSSGAMKLQTSVFVREISKNVNRRSICLPLLPKSIYKPPMSCIGNKNAGACTVQPRDGAYATTDQKRRAGTEARILLESLRQAIEA